MPAASNAATAAGNSATASDRTAEVLRKHREYIWPAVANLYERPLVTDRAHMQHVWDLEGRRYLISSAAFSPFPSGTPIPR